MEEIKINTDGTEYNFQNEKIQKIASFNATKPNNSKWWITVRNDKKPLFARQQVSSHDIINLSSQIGGYERYMVKAECIEGSGTSLTLKINYMN